jgi:hypothetical protein
LLALLTAANEPLLLPFFEARLAGESLRGEWVPAPLGPLATILLALSGWLFVRALGRLIAQYVLGLKRHATLTISPRGLELFQEFTFLGRKLRQQQRFIPFAQLVSLEREHRFRGVALHLGLLALTLGTFLGTGLLIDGLRVAGGSPRLITMGGLAIVAGIALDLVLSHLPVFQRGRVRVVVRAARTKPWILDSLKPAEADRALLQLKACCSVRS